MKNQIETVRRNSPVVNREGSVAMPIGKLQLGLVIDKSGSMDLLRTAVIQSINRLVTKQRELSAGAIVSLRTFNKTVDEVFVDVPIQEVRPISGEGYFPAGGTALLDGIGATIDAIWHSVAAAPRTPVVIAICSDGEENASTKYGKIEIREQIINKRFIHGWQFLFLSSDQRAIKFALDIGIAKEAIIEFRADPQGLTAILDKFSQGLTSYRLGNRKALLQLKG